ncbi:MAG TPA: hypothetical protein VGL93_23035 [Streptosporangiaceae bacterium]|jgi:ATP/ADP translocase
MSDVEKAAGRTVSYPLRFVLTADAVWDAVVGVVFCLASSRMLAGWAWFPALRPWPLFVIIGVGCLVFAVVLARGVRDPNAAQFARLVAIGNAAAAVIAGLAAVLLAGPATRTAITLAIVAVGCAVFAVLEWLLSGRMNEAG